MEENTCIARRSGEVVSGFVEQGTEILLEVMKDYRSRVNEDLKEISFGKIKMYWEY